MGNILNSHSVAKWFIYNNPSLASGYFDENAKLNKLLYFSNLMYHCVNDKSLLDESFVAFPKGPVIKSIYIDYRYNNLGKVPVNDHIEGIDKEQLQILNIINFVYADRPTDSLIEESHNHSLWKDVEKYIPNNPLIDFSNIEPCLIDFYNNLFNAYKDFNFSEIKKEKINGNTFYYKPSNLTMNDEVITELSAYGNFSSPQFLEMVDGELVFS